MTRSTHEQQRTRSTLEQGMRHVAHVVELWESGEGDEKKIKQEASKAKEILRPFSDPASKQGKVIAAHELANMYAKMGEYYIHSLMKAASMHNDRQATKCLRDAEKNLVQVMEWPGRSKDELYCSAAYGLSRVYIFMEQMDGVDRGEKIHSLVEEAARGGHWEAELSMAEEHLFGGLVPISDRSAKHWLDRLESKKEKLPSDALDHIAEIKNHYDELHAMGRQLASRRLRIFSLSRKVL